MKRDAFLRALKAHADANNLAYDWNPKHGKGGHGRVTVGAYATTVPTKINTGLQYAILRQLRLPKDVI